MPTHLEDSDGNNADDDSIDSFMQRQNNFGYRESDDVPTRDVGPERLPNLFSQVKKIIWLDGGSNPGGGEHFLFSPVFLSCNLMIAVYFQIIS